MEDHPIRQNARTRWLIRPALIRVDSLACARDLSGPLPANPPPPGVSIRAAEPPDFPELATAMARADFRGDPLMPADIERRYRRGDICLLAELRGKIAYLSWICRDASLSRLGLVLPLRSDEAYVDSVFAMPEYRDQGLATAVGVERLRWLHARGIRVACGWVAPHNAPMLKVMERVGWRVVGSVNLPARPRARTRYPNSLVGQSTQSVESVNFRCYDGRCCPPGRHRNRQRRGVPCMNHC